MFTEDLLMRFGISKPANDINSWCTVLCVLHHLKPVGYPTDEPLHVETALQIQAKTLVWTESG